MLEGKALIQDTDMPVKMQMQAMACASQALDLYDVIDCKSIAAHIKKEFDRRYGGGWQCVVGSQFGCFFTHSKGSFIYFTLETLQVVIFKDLSQPSLYHTPRHKVPIKDSKSAGIGILSPILDPQIVVKSTMRASILGTAFECYYKHIYDISTWSKLEFCKSTTVSVGQNCYCQSKLDFDGLKIKSKRNFNSMDRFSELPDYIIHQIMSYLPTEESAQTSILSKRWKGLYASYPILDFPDFYTGFSSGKYRTNKFIEFVDASFLRFCQQKLPMQKFRLSIDGFDDLKGSFSFFDKWIRLAIEKKVEELDFSVQAHRRPMYTLPQEIFSAKSMTTLKLGSCKLENPFIMHSLKSLSLKEACINEEVLQKITSQCTSLEDLFLSSCYGFTNICLYNACKLKIINMQNYSWNLQSIKIVVPSLQHFIFCSQYKRDPIVIDMAGCPNLKLLKLQNVGFTEQKFHELISKFPLLEDLNVSRCDPLEQIKISSHLLKKFSIGYCYRMKAIDIDAPNLLSFTYDLTCPIPVFSINAPILWKVGFVHQIPVFNIKEFLNSSNQIEYLSFYVDGDKVISMNSVL
ncbi:hypothetical protein Dsin_013804 [Dipteronia sinensis]|uniref:F-box domain-containing protein n=1 Tax=Dipteronia sinensis TaxID=43782 RepID=A0AAE0E9G2_9ROSI|nr:hypothetical protein Dsin_013804 [Dipteronia sinensis]